MGRIVLYVIIVSVTFIFGNADAKSKSNANTQKWRYEIECDGTGTDGTFLVKVWSYAPTQVAAIKQATKNAVHGVVFKGVAGKSGQCPAQRAIAASPGIQYEKADYFNKFFDDGGEYQKYANVIGLPESVKVGCEYKVGVVVSVSKDQLRKDLESAGIIKGLSSGF